MQLCIDCGMWCPAEREKRYRTVEHIQYIEVGGGVHLITQFRVGLVPP